MNDWQIKFLIETLEEENAELLERISKLEKSNRNWRRKCQRLRSKLRGYQEDCREDLK